MAFKCKQLLKDKKTEFHLSSFPLAEQWNRIAHAVCTHRLQLWCPGGKSPLRYFSVSAFRCWVAEYRLQVQLQVSGLCNPLPLLRPFILSTGLSSTRREIPCGKKISWKIPDLALPHIKPDTSPCQINPLTKTHGADKLPSAALHSFTDRNTQFQDMRS